MGSVILMNITVNRNEMQNSVNVSVSDRNGSISNHAVKGEKKEQEKGSIFAGDLNIADTQEARSMKLLQAQRKALKGKMDEFANKQETEEMITGLEDKKTELASEKMQACDNVSDAQNKLKQLKDQYKIEDDSEEQKNVDLLEKSMKDPLHLSLEEKEKLSNMGPLTEYQSQAVEQIKAEVVNQRIASSANLKSESISKAITGIELSELKSAPMIEAQKASDQIMEAAADAIVSDAMKETKDNVDDKLDKVKEDAEKLAEEDKKQEERIEKQVEKQQEAKEEVTDNHVTENQAVPDTQQAKVDESLDNLEAADAEYEKMQAEIKKMLKQMNINGNDIKGITLDELI
jgi:hypothetical protein